jgi:hypothetical protein
VTSVSSMVRDRTSIVWLVLVVATLASWMLGSEDAGAARMGSCAILLIAFIKVRLIGRHFMEIKDSPRTLRIAFDIYVIVSWSLLTGFYIAC